MDNICDYCRGVGYAIDMPCMVCKGLGIIKLQKCSICGKGVKRLIDGDFCEVCFDKV